MTNIEVLTENQNPTEREFVTRELGIKLKIVDNTDIAGEDLNFILSDNPISWHTLLKKSKKESVVFFLIGNETYEPWKYEYFNNFDSIKHVFIYNPPRTYQYSDALKSLLGNFLDGGIRPNRGNGNMIRDFKTSLYKMRQISSIIINYPWTELPQGYSNVFVDQLKSISGLLARQLQEIPSLFDCRTLDLILNFRKVERNFGYVGQYGNHRRETCLRIARESFAVETQSRSGFHGNLSGIDTLYISLLLSSRFTLVPPGYFNNSNHRYLESLLTGGLPAILYQNSLDVSESTNWTRALGFPQTHSFKKLIKRLEGLSSTEFQYFRDQALLNEWNKVLNVKQVFKQLADA